MKTAMYYQHHFDNHLAARTAVMEYIESWYNRRRPHSHNEGLQPAAALATHRDRRQIAAA
jgi:transposase InsO family protein